MMVVVVVVVLVQEWPKCHRRCYGSCGGNYDDDDRDFDC